MPPGVNTRDASAAADIKIVPPTGELRCLIRSSAESAWSSQDRVHAPSREMLDLAGRELLHQLHLPESYLGFTMVALSNAFWRAAFAAIPYTRRLFLLPHCMRDESRCSGTYDSLGLHCAGCGSCHIAGLKARAEALGYRVLTAEGTTAVTNEILDEERDAILGVACMDSLEKSFARVAELGLPNLAIPLLSNGCARTQAETGLIEELLAERSDTGVTTETYLPLLREARRMCTAERLVGLLAPCIDRHALVHRGPDAGADTVTYAIDWLREGGKRFRPFVTLAAYAVARHGKTALRPDADLNAMLPPAVRRLALAIEILHKASLVHDDIEDGSAFRYGRPTLHAACGIPFAVNVGDYLVGLGYRLVAGERDALGADGVAEIMAHLTSAHLQLCRGQGAELQADERLQPARPLDVLAIHALKTAPAFEAALYAGLRAAGTVENEDALQRFSTYLGEGYQILNDLDDWRADEDNKVEAGHDVVLRRPTILRALALEADAGPALAEATKASSGEERLARTRKAYEESGAFSTAETLVSKLRERALKVSSEFKDEPLRELLGFLVRTVLPLRP